VLFCGGRLSESGMVQPFQHATTVRSPCEAPCICIPSSTPCLPTLAPACKADERLRCVIHLNAQPRRRQGTWVACGAAAETVVRMDARYLTAAPSQ